jgi:hypothetical protein
MRQINVRISNSCLWILLLRLSAQFYTLIKRSRTDGDWII